MTKVELKAALVAHVTAALAQARAAHQSAIEGAVHEEAKAENDKDTRGLEQSYLARGQAQRVAELETGLLQTQSMTIEPAALGKIGAIVVSDEDEHFFIAPAGGGTQIEGYQVVTPTSPLGRALLGKRAGDDVELKLPKQQRTFVVRSIQ